MKIEYDGICANVLKYSLRPCAKCAFAYSRVCIGMYKFDHLTCIRDGFEKDQGFIFKI